jgi:hypothetical protein
MATAEQYAQWIVDNQDKRGTPDFDTVVQAYQAARSMPVSAPSKDISFGEAATNVGGALIGGVGKTIQLPGQLYGLATGDFAETGSLGLGKKIEKFGEEMKSEGFKARKQERAAKIAEAEKEGQASAFGTAFGETVKDPALLVDFLAETVPQLLVPFGIGRATAAATGARQLAKGAAAAEAAKVAGRVGTSAAVGTGAIQQGADVGAGSYEAIYKELLSKGVSEADAKESALNLARAAGSSGALISLLAQKLPGARRLEEAMAGVPSKAGRIRGALGTAAGETLGEIPEEVGGKFTQNIAMREVKPEQELTAGLGETAAMAAIGGAGLGGAAGLARGRAKPEVKPEVPEVLEAKRAPEEPTKLEEEKVQPIAEATQVEAAQDIQAGEPAEPSPVVATQVVNVGGKESTKTTRQDGSVEVDGVQIVPPKTETERETTQITPTTEGEEDVARPNEPTSGTGVPVPVRAADELPAAEGIEGTEQRGVDGAGPAPTEPTGGEGIQPAPVKDYAYKSYEELEYLYNNAKKINHDMDIAAIKKHFGVEAADAYEKMNRFQRDKWWDANATEEFERDSSVFNGINEETINDYITAYNKFDTESPELLGRSIATPSLKMKEPDFIGSPEMLTINNALDYAKKQGWSEKEVIDGMRARAAELAKGDAYELFPHLFKPKKTKESAVSSSNMESLESSEKGAGYNIDPQEQTIEKELAGKNFMQVAQWAVRSAPNAFAKVIAQKVLSRLQGMQSRGVKFDFKVEAGNERSTKLRGARGVTNFVFGKTGEDTTIKITLNGATVMDNQAGFPSGMNYVTVLHELLHAATRGQLKFMQSSDPLVKELIGLRNKVIKHFNDTDPKDMTPFMKRYYNRENNSLDNIDEMVSWGMTDEDMQKFLGEIKVGEKTGFSKLVETIRKILGLGQPYESALDRLVKTTESILDESIDVIGDGIESQGYSYGTKAGKKPRGQQQSLFSKKVQEIFGEEFSQQVRKNIYGNITPSTWITPEMTNIDDAVYKMQDKLVDTKKVIDAIEKSSQKISEKWNPYLKEELFHGRTATQTKDFLSKELRPLLQALQSKNISIQEFEEYLHNRTAEERNNQIAKVNPQMPDGGSGIDTKDARAYLSKLSGKQKKDFEDLAKMSDDITKVTRKILVNSGLETQETIDTWEKTYKSYVPLNREDIDYGSGASGTGAGKGFSVRGASTKRAMGSSAKVVDILANIAMQRERAIVRAEKNRVANALYGLAVQNPNTDFWLSVDPLGQKDITKAVNDLIQMGINPIDAKNIIQEPVQKYIDPKTGLVVERINPALRSNDNVLATRINGQDKFVFFNPNNDRAQRMVAALKNLDADQLGRVLGIFSAFTRYFASINTQYNPIFGAYNFIRDAESAALQLSTTEIAGKEGEVIKNSIPALKGIYSSLRAERSGKSVSGQWESLWRDFIEQGGQTGFRDQFSKSEERNKALQDEIKKISEGSVKKAGRAIFDWLSDYNETMENAIRLSTYKAALDDGISKEKAASIAKNISVNFNRKGQIGVQANALYAFFNAAVQGTTRLVETIRGPLGKKIIGGGLLLGSIQAMLLAAAGFDDDEPPEFIKEKNFVIPLFGTEGKYIAIPFPLGYNVIPNTSRVLTEWSMSGFKKTDKRLEAILGSYMDAFNPIGNAGWSVQTISPTIADPIVALAENKDWTGKTIAKKDLNSLDPTPGYTRAKDTASFFGKKISEFLNWSTGGTKYAPGLLSPTPDQIDYLIGQATGGVGRELLKAQQTVSSVITGEELPEHKIPLTGRFYGNVKSGASQANKFYENIKEINIHENEVKGRRENRENVSEYLKEHPEARLADRAKEAQRNIANLKKRKAALIEKDAPKESVTAIENQITRQMQRFNEAVERAQR